MQKAHFEADWAANDECNGLSLGFADALRGGAPALVPVHHLVRLCVRPHKRTYVLVGFMLRCNQAGGLSVAFPVPMAT
jgi:hypothetical protein